MVDTFSYFNLNMLTLDIITQDWIDIDQFDNDVALFYNFVFDRNQILLKKGR